VETRMRLLRKTLGSSHVNVKIGKRQHTNYYENTHPETKSNELHTLDLTTKTIKQQF
jgi:hypothetical protein